jgi:hypothetical protein
MPVRCLSNTAVLYILHCFLDFVVVLANLFDVRTRLRLRM